MIERAGGSGTTAFEHSLLIKGSTTRVLEAFFDPGALAVWWKVRRSVTTPRPLGVYAIEWEPSAEPDEILGRLGGVFHGTVADYAAGREFFVADAWWLPPDGDPLGPMSLEVTCEMEGAACRLRIRQNGPDEGDRWRRYFSVIERGWLSALTMLKSHVESAASRD